MTGMAAADACNPNILAILKTQPYNPLVIADSLCKLLSYVCLWSCPSASFWQPGCIVQHIISISLSIAMFAGSRVSLQMG